VTAIEGSGVDLTGAEATVLRDLAGSLRLHLRRPAGAPAWPAETKSRLQAAVKRLAPYATETVFLDTADGAGKGKFPLADVLDRDRAPLDVATTIGAPPTVVASWFKLERRYSKDAWLTTTGQPVEPWPYGEGPTVISFYGFKGGVGRTTALAAAALHFTEKLGKRVVVVDLDLESPGAGRLLMGETSVDLGVVDYIVEDRLGAAKDLPISRFAQVVPTDAGELRVIPAGRLDGAFLEKLGRVDLQGLVEPNRAARNALASLLQRVRGELKPNAVLLDVRAGLHDLGGITLAGLSHLELIFAVHSPQSWAGLELVLAHLGRLRADWVKLVHAMVPPARLGGDDLHRAFLQKAYDVCSGAYYEAEKIPGEQDPDAAHSAYVLPFREALLALDDARAARADLLSDEHRVFCEALAKDAGLV
jgi:cellulose biosynthesis protein BcsQ